MTSPAAPVPTWLTGVYELNFPGEAWLGFGVIASANGFATRDEVENALGVSIDGDSYVSRDPAVVARARQSLRPGWTINAHPEPETLAVFAQHVPALSDAHVVTFALSDSRREPADMCHALEPAATYEEAIERLQNLVMTTPRTLPVEDQMLRQITGKDVGPGEDQERSEFLRLLHSVLLQRPTYWQGYFGDMTLGIVSPTAWNPSPQEPDPQPRKRGIVARLISKIRGGSPSSSPDPIGS